MKLPLTPLDLLTRARRLFPDRVGVIDGDVRRTYREFAERCDRLAFALRDELGVRPGDRVAWLCGNTSELLEAYFGVLLAGGVLLPLNIRLAAAESRFVLDDASAVVLFRHPDQPDVGHAVRQVVLGDEYEALLARQPAESFPVPVVDEDDVAELFYTSGSTGRPKGVLLTHRSLYLHAIHSALTSNISGEDVIVHTIPLFHVNGWGTPHFLTGLGGVHVMLPRFDAGEVLRLIEAEGVTRLFGVPAMMRMILDHPDVATRDLSTLRQVSVGGAPTPPTLLAEIEERLGCECICGYGMTEASPSLTRSLTKPGATPSVERRATTGLPLLGVDVRVLDDDDREVPWDDTTTGEVCARSNHVMSGYLDRPEETAAALRGGWLRTGDVAVVTPDGYLRIVDRKKDLVISGGENVSTVEVEHVLSSHPAVHEVAVVGRPDERWGEVPVAWVSLRPDAEATPEELIAFTRERLAGFKAPKRVTIVDELPHGGTGKILKHELRSRG
ncbi:long-chain-fatty-acid--CoA ligase [Actinomarinicola tropica]|uniref:Long-chain-fatty-acid--CoA ligase n=1 Tax=Actinomarinicola tropica TaxID=2789776 RepID=A0A5Q2RT01_9ACTN|nr:long-chain-fatty-acid--CoA ligase [Actinomarinicola tropica]QGG96335.1 long-chain-fatty-acid--CoA ligase [Actinomarinicola tropica]